jgi:hypothetical protein
MLTFSSHLIHVRIAIIKNTPQVLARMWRKRNPSTLMVGMQTSATTLEKIWWLLKNINIDLLYDPAIPLLGIYPKECNSGYSKSTCTPMFVAVLFTITKL